MTELEIRAAIRMAEDEAIIGEKLKGRVSQDWPKALRILSKVAKKTAKQLREDEHKELLDEIATYKILLNTSYKHNRDLVAAEKTTTEREKALVDALEVLYVGCHEMKLHEIESYIKQVLAKAAIKSIKV